VCDSSKYVDKSIGIDFSRKMIDIASKKIEEKKHNNCDFLYGSIFDISLTKNMFDLISANGFIEYISEDELIIFLGIVYKALSPSGSLVLGSRNRLFNIFSLNSFTTKEINSGYLDLLLAESIHWTSGKTIKEILGPKLAPTQCNNETHSKTGVNVSTRFQYTPFQLIDILSSCGFEAVEIYPIYVHGAPPSFKNNNLAVHTKISNILQDYARNNQELVPFSSSFMLHIKKK